MDRMGNTEKLVPKIMREDIRMTGKKKKDIRIRQQVKQSGQQIECRSTHTKIIVFSEQWHTVWD